jgi:hypothetical protein
MDLPTNLNKMKNLPNWWRENRELVKRIANLWFLPAKFKKVLNALFVALDTVIPAVQPYASSMVPSGEEQTRICDIMVEVV